MTNAQILAQTRLTLKTVRVTLKMLRKKKQTPVIVDKIRQLEELQENLEIDIEDLRGAIAVGADSPNPLAGWC